MKNTVKNIFPEKIRCVAVTAPAGRPAPEKLTEAIKIWSGMVKVKNFIAGFSDHTPSYLAAAAADRVNMFNAAISDPEVDLILAVRGGFGSVHILPEIDYAALKKRNLPVMGYSDITALHCAMLAKHAGIPIAGSNLLQISEVLNDELSLTSHALALQNDPPESQLPVINLEAVKRKTENITVKAPAYAANLTVLSSLCGTEFMPDFSNYILIIEDVNEPLYKLDRMFEQLRLNGIFNNLSALVFGKYSGVENHADELNKLFEQLAEKLKIPCFKNFVFGHEFPMYAVNSSHIMTIKND